MPPVVRANLSLIAVVVLEARPSISAMHSLLLKPLVPPPISVFPLLPVLSVIPEFPAVSAVIVALINLSLVLVVVLASFWVVLLLLL